ncbi:NAD-dependent epimerase/dehydratase family protein [Phytohabitans suffuscus]|uniref:NAD-dependent epimerase/dehydratase domain-containing protein n=1 Tax=Phytohabitans suffuscus TaxID=624315 RepID=A0A6F8YUL3_9ACTN|nr:hypothetical protein Psuf_071400 [Phytohabitans suffuscus]
MLVSRTALVIGGTGPTGPHVVGGLLARGWEVAVLHRGTHELPELDTVEHLHADPHFREPIAAALGPRRFDLAVATYGRLRHVADALAGSADRFVAVSGLPVYPGYHEPERVWPHGMPLLAREGAAARRGSGGGSPGARFSDLIFRAEEHVLALHRAGAFSATLFRYPSIYGPRQLYPREWSVIRRVLDGRAYIIVPDGGLTLLTRCAARNAAAFLLAAVDRPEPAAGEVFNVADLSQYSLAQWIQLTAAAAGREIELVSLPFDLAGPGRALFPVPHTAHGLVSAGKAVARLGYTEAVPAVEALRDTVRWYLEHPPDQSVTGRLADTFDYAEEDRVLREYRSATAGLRARQPAAVAVAHPYPHPKTAGGVDHRAR